MPAYISLCRKTLLKNCSNSFNIVELDEKNIYIYLPELKQIEIPLNLNQLKIAQKVDYYRILLLYKYGGLYIDSDMIIINDLKKITEKLRMYDYIGFGEYFYPKHNLATQGFTYGAPQNWAMASRKKGILVTHLLKRATEILLATKGRSPQQLEYFIRLLSPLENHLELPWHSLGKYLIRSTLKTILEKGYHYYHYGNDIDGTRDIFGKLIDTKIIFSNKEIKFKDKNKLLFVFISNLTINTKQNKLQYVLEMTEEQLLNANTNFALLIKQSLGKTKNK